jgi:hypothetical protein
MLIFVCIDIIIGIERYLLRYGPIISVSMMHFLLDLCLPITLFHVCCTLVFVSHLFPVPVRSFIVTQNSIKHSIYGVLSLHDYL